MQKVCVLGGGWLRARVGVSGFRGHLGITSKGICSISWYYFELYGAQDAGFKGFSERLTVDSPGDSSLQVTLADRGRRRRLQAPCGCRDVEVCQYNPAEFL